MTEMENDGGKKKNGPKAKSCRVSGVSIPHNIVSIYRIHMQSKSIYANKNFGCFFFLMARTWENQKG